MNKIAPTILKGTRDFLPEEMARRNFVMSKIKEKFEQFGFAPIETPILCPGETILGKYGDEGEKLTYSFRDAGDRLIALPYDLTVPFARYVAANYPNLPMPFKRYQIQRVWRAEKPQKGRLREFYQCDIDIIGSNSLICEADITKVMVEVFESIGIADFTIKFNSRRLINAILNKNNIPGDKVIPIIRSIDKIVKIGKDAVINEIKVIGVVNAEKIIDLLTKETSNEKALAKLRDYDTGELKKFIAYCEKLGIPSKYLEFDPMLARGLDYYTGMIFEVVGGTNDFGTICGGGRYDDLCSMFSDKNFSGIGVSFGFERIMLLLKQSKLLGQPAPTSKVLVTIFNQELLGESLKIYNDLIGASVGAELYIEPCKIAKQFKYADKKKIPFVLIVGPEEIERNAVVVKRMDNGKQKEIPRNQLISYLQGYYESK